MFYPNMLISHRRRNKLASCWFAATLSEQSFKKRYNARTIKELSIEQICQEIMEMQLDGNVPMRSSLRLSAQLMGGVTKIYSYQVNYCLKEAFKIRPMCEDEDHFRAIEMPPVDPVIEMPLSGPNILNVPLEKDLHVLSDMSDERLNMAMKAATCLDFGYLDKDLHLMLMCDEDVAFARDLERLHINAEEDILERTEIQEQQLSQEIRRPMLVDISRNLTERLPLTPQKRATKEPRETQVETPTKRRRLSLEGATMTEPPGPVEDVTRQADIELESVHSSYFVVDKPLKKTTLVIDKNIALSDKLLKRWRQNVNIHCKPLATSIVPRLLPTSAKDLLTQPSHSRWNARLCKRFHDRIAGPFTSVTEDVAPAELGQLAEAMRVPEEPMSKLNLPMDVSTFKRTDIAIAEPIDSTANILPDAIHQMDVDVPMVPEVVHDMITLENTGIGPRPHQENSNIADTNESFEDIEKYLLKKQQPVLQVQHIPASPAISRGSSQPQLTSQELYALLQVLWCDKEFVRFSDLIPNKTYTKRDAVTAFRILLELEAQKKLVLHQDSSFRTVRISKYNYSK